MNNLQISDVTNYDFKLIGSNELELVVHQVNASTTIHLFPARKEAPVAPVPTPVSTVDSTPTSKPLPPVRRTTVKRTKKNARSRKPSSPGADREYIIQDRVSTLGRPVATKLTENEVRMIRELWPAALDDSPSKRQALLQLADMFDISAANIEQIIERRTWKHID